MPNPAAAPRFRLLGPPLLESTAGASRFQRRKSVALLAYIALEPGAHARDSLCSIFWPECDRPHARGNLRSSLFEICHVLGDGCMACSQDLVELGATVLCTDALDLMRALDASGTARDGMEDARLIKAVRGWAGGFMAGFTLPGCADFDDWQFDWTSKTKEAYCRALRLLATRAFESQQLLTADEMALRWVEAAPLDEDARGMRIRVLLAQGKLEGARAYYERWSRIVKLEFGREPRKATRDLVASFARPTSKPAGRVGREEAPRNGRLFGREGELRAIESSLREKPGKLLTLVGPGGVGKTRLALGVLERAGSTFPGGAWFVDLSSELDPGMIASRIGAVMGLRASTAGTAEAGPLVESRIGKARCLLVLDNMEQLEGAFLTVASLTRACPGLSVLATSRSPIGLPDEEEFDIKPLPFPAPDQMEAPGKIEDWAALEFLLTLVMAARPGFAVDPDTLSGYARICARMDGLPLALELAAPLVDLLGPTQALDALERGLESNSLPGPTAPDRHKDLSSVVEWSYAQLAPLAKRLYAGLAVFEESFDLGSAECLAAGPEGRGGKKAESPSWVLPELARLVRMSLVRRREDGSSTRFFLLCTIRDHASRKLEESGEEEACRDMAARHFLERAEEAAKILQGPRQREILHDLGRDEDNFEASIIRFVSRSMYPEALGLCRALDWYWFRTGRHANAIRMLGLALGPEKGPGSPARQGLRGACLRSLAWFRLTTGDWHDAHALYLEALPLIEAAGDRKELVRCLSDLGVVERWLGNWPGGDARSRKAVELAREEGGDCLLAIALVWQHGTQGGRPATDGQKSGLVEAIRLARQADAPWLLAHAHGSLGEFLREQDRFQEAIPHFERALRGFLDVEDGWMRAWTLEGYGSGECRAGEAEAGMARLREAFGLFFRLGAKGDALYVLGRLGLAAAGLGRTGDSDLLLGCFSGLRGELGLETLAMSFDPGRPEAGPAMREALADAKARNSAAWRQGLRTGFEEAKELVCGP